HDVHLIEVKYMRNMSALKVLSAAELMYRSWKPSYLFVATPSGFFFGAAKQIVAESGTINKLEHIHIPTELQQKYVDLLNAFLPSRVREALGRADNSMELNPQEKRIRELFRLGIFLKGIHAAIEIVGGLLLLV